MSLDSVTEDIKEQARARAEEIRSDAEQRAERIVEEAEQEAEEIRRQKESEIERQIEQEREQRLSSGNLEAKQKQLAARRQTLEEVRERVEDALVNLDEETREELTRELIEAAITEFEDVETAEVYGRSDDEALLTSILEEYDSFEYGGETDCLGGVVVESDASRVRIDNTFDSVLEDVWQESLREISDELFEEQ
ncbi:V-type ATP synthase subunit E [Halapricum hydrolyticum]|uniref:A-type ATP synthase subunit E n=1 Tax=Halapricum hydrolyticum TaxID=2979991 RepID=A0AAE3IBM8_9EURY|nr:V-type ATP synthase subunit E [Halapricum hydrolyticum]MCU4717852.1 V-type ATP synthase subunit E [Halapricum hydrolyticum]MCU4727016.1 V-type ATP synthase subunit E [Halapricum hydrolyticum]